MRKPLISIGLSQFGLSILQTLFMFYYVKVYTNQFHINTKWFNIAQTLFMFWNTINDPLFGYLQEIRGSWYNNRLLVIKYLAPFLVISFVFVWIPWNTTGSDSEGVHLILALFFYDAFFSALGVAWSAYFADNTKNSPAIRVKALKYSQIAILVSILSISITEKLSESTKKFEVFQIICVTVGLMSLLCLWLSAKVSEGKVQNTLEERNDDEIGLIDNNEVPIKQLTFNENVSSSINLTKQIITQKQFLAIVITNFFHTGRSVAHLNFASMITEVLIPQDILPTGSIRLSLFFMILTLGPQLVLIANEKSFAKYSANRVIQFSYIISFLSGFMIFFSENPYIIMLFMLIDCVTVHTIAPLFNILLSDFVDDDTRKHNRDAGIPSIIFSLNALFAKPAQSIAPVIILNILKHSGYQDYLQTKTTTLELKNTVINVLFMTPLLIGAIQYLIMHRFYNIKSNRHQRESHII